MIAKFSRALSRLYQSRFLWVSLPSVAILKRYFVTRFVHFGCVGKYLGKRGNIPGSDPHNEKEWNREARKQKLVETENKLLLHILNPFWNPCTTRTVKSLQIKQNNNENIYWESPMILKCQQNVCKFAKCGIWCPKGTTTYSMIHRVHIYGSVSGNYLVELNVAAPLGCRWRRGRGSVRRVQSARAWRLGLASTQ